MQWLNYEWYEAHIGSLSLYLPASEGTGDIQSLLKVPALFGFRKIALIPLLALYVALCTKHPVILLWTTVLPREVLFFLGQYFLSSHSFSLFSKVGFFSFLFFFSLLFFFLSFFLFSFFFGGRGSNLPRNAKGFNQREETSAEVVYVAVVGNH